MRCFSEVELQGWREFYRLYPFDDYHRFHRPAALIAGMQSTNPQQAITGHLKWLQPEPVLAEFGEFDMKTLKAFGLKPPPAFTQSRKH